MLDVDHISKVRLAHFRDGKGIREIAHEVGPGPQHPPIHYP